MARTRREQIWKRADERCEYCQMPQQYDVRPFQIDHVRAQKHRGTSGLNIPDKRSQIKLCILFCP